MLASALAFQYLGGLPPCHLCNLQRWPLRWLEQYPQRIKAVYRYPFLLGGIYMLWAVWFRMVL